MDGDRLVGRDGAREFVIGHIRPTPRPVDGEEPKARGWKSVQMSIGIGDVLAGELRRAVERNRGFDPLVDREGQLAVRAVDRGGGGVDEMRAAGELARGLEER